MDHKKDTGNEALFYGFHTSHTLRKKLDSLPDGEFIMQADFGIAEDWTSDEHQAGETEVYG